MTYRNDHDEFMSKTPVIVNRRIQAEVEQLAWSRLPLWKRTWLKTKRCFDFNDPYPFPQWKIRSKLDKVFAFLTVATFIGIVILLCYVVYWTIVILSIVDSIGAF